MGLASLLVLGTHAQRIALLMSYTVVDDDNMIQVRASINRNTEKDEIRKLILALVNRHPDLVGMTELRISLGGNPQ